MNDLESIRQEISAIKDRNKRVEAAKAWEQSWTRRLSVAALTYALVVIVMVMAKFETPFLQALIPTAAYLVSVSSISFLKKRWIQKHLKS